MLIFEFGDQGSVLLKIGLDSKEMSARLAIDQF